MSLRRNVFRPVWPDDGIKSCPIFHNIALKSSQIIFTRKLYLLKLPKNLPEYFGYYFKIKWLPRSLKSPNLVTLLPTIPSFWENPLKKVCIRRPNCKCTLGLSLSLSLSLSSLFKLSNEKGLFHCHILAHEKPFKDSQSMFQNWSWKCWFWSRHLASQKTFALIISQQTHLLLRIDAKELFKADSH